MVGSRTTQTVVRFTAPFVLPGLDGPEPAGDYRIDHDEETIDGFTWVAWRRIKSYIHLPAIGTGRSTREMAPINPADLEDALERDRNT